MHFIQSSLVIKLALLAAVITTPELAKSKEITFTRCFNDEMARQRTFPWDSLSPLPDPFGIIANQVANLENTFDGPKCAGGDLNRTATLYVPDSVINDATNAPTLLPLVINIHALAFNVPGQQYLSQFDKIAEKEKFLVLYPQGYSKAQLLNTPLPAPGPNYSFNAGGCCSWKPIDDIGYFRELVEYIQTDKFAGNLPKNHRIDPTRIYVTGMSNGGFMTHRVACEMSDIVAAAAPVAGVLMPNYDGPEPHVFEWGADSFTCNPKRPVPLLHIHSENDAVVPLNGSDGVTFADASLLIRGIEFVSSIAAMVGLDLGFPSVETSTAQWRKNNNVDSTPSSITTNGKCTVFDNTSDSNSPSARVELCVLGVGKELGVEGHCWPGNDNGLQCGDEDVNSQYIWDFFKNERLTDVNGDKGEL